MYFSWIYVFSLWPTHSFHTCQLAGWESVPWKSCKLQICYIFSSFRSLTGHNKMLIKPLIIFNQQVIVCDICRSRHLWSFWAQMYWLIGGDGVQNPETPPPPSSKIWRLYLYDSCWCIILEPQLLWITKPDKRWNACNIALVKFM